MHFHKSIFLFLALFFGLTSCSEDFELSPESDTFFHVKIEGTELPVWVRGNTQSNQFIIYINGGPGLTSIDVAKADLFNWTDYLEKEAAVIYYDQRGCGNAQGNLDENTLTIAQYVKDLDAIITVIQSKYSQARIFLMGHSFGSFIGANYLLTEKLQNKITGWISVDGAYNFDFDLTWQFRRTFLINIANEEISKGKMVEHWQEALSWANNNPQITTREQKNEWRSFIGLPGGRIIPEELGELSLSDYLGIGFASSYNPFPAFASRNLDIVNDRLNEEAEGINLISSVPGITIPSLFIWGRYDDLIPPEEGLSVFENLGTHPSKRTFLVMENSSHEPYLSEPEVFQKAIITFLDTQ